ncbi:hypothetical protein TanjilG_21197 [Lupinus angustifolius]|uniref:RRM domain-containing protein n=1 Tax=Lupinus angustifolius TaxID=3871 RepID=A0A1J7GEK5_LUPAN|nr:hypothetical protein TanjilG_21197 [Lupinus angustifolius]
MGFAVSNYLLGGDIQAREFVATNEVKENGVVDNYGFSENKCIKSLILSMLGRAMLPQSQMVHFNLQGIQYKTMYLLLLKNLLESPKSTLMPPLYMLSNYSIHFQIMYTFGIQLYNFGTDNVTDYCCKLRVAKGQSTASQPPQKNVSSSEWDSAPQTSSQPATVSANAFERSESDAVDEFSATEYEDEIKSIYVRNLSPIVSPSAIEEEFQNFGRVRPDGVVIRSQKDVGICYAFVEFEDMTGVQNAVKAGSVQIAGRQAYIEERRPNSNIPSRGGSMPSSTTISL